MIDAFKRALRAAGFALVLLVGVAAPSAQAKKAEGPPAVVQVEPARDRFPHEKSGLAVDPAVRYGILPNGMRYAIMRNDLPAGTASLRLRFAAGSLYESEPEQGIAHYLEHMAFNGSENVPEGEMVKLLQRAGLAFGPDTNAYTSFDETVYMLDLPKTDPETVTTALKLLRETGGRLTLAPEAIDRERGVVLSEERSRDSPEFRRTRANWAFLFKGLRLPERFPIGTVESLNAIDAPTMRAFYERLYRPERAFLVAVGDFDPQEMESRIKARFADWTAPASQTQPQIDLGKVPRRGLEVETYVEAGLPSSVSLSWVTPPDLSPDSAAQRREDYVRAVAYAVLNRRLERIARSATPPFLSASAGRSVYQRSATLASISASTRPGQWQEGLKAIDQELRRALIHGLSQGEIAREIAEYRAALQNEAASADTRDTRSLADGIAGAYGSDEAFVHPATTLALFEEAVKGLAPEAFTHLLREDFQYPSRATKPLVFVAAGEPIEGGEKAVLAAYRQSARVKPEAAAASEEVAFDYEFGAPGAVADRAQNAEFGFSTTRFANGVQLTVKPTTYEKDVIYVTVRLHPSGLAHKAFATPGLALFSASVLSEAGLGRLTQEDLERALAGKVVSAGFGVDDEDVTLSGRTRPEDLALQLELLAAYVVDPGWREEGLKRLQAFAENFIKQYETAPGRVMARDAGYLLHAKDARWKFPDLEEARALKMEDFRAAFAPYFEQAGIEVSIVGDVDPERATELVAATFGALNRPAAQARETAPVRFPEGGGPPVRLTHKGRADQAAALRAWRAVDFSDARKARAVRLATNLLETRLVEEFREAKGETYSPQTGEDLSQVFPGYGYVSASVEAKPEVLDDFLKTLDALTKEIREDKFDADALLRARAPLIDRLKTSEKTNPYWAAVLADVQSNPRRLDLMRTRVTDLEAITRAEVVAAAREVFRPERAVTILVTPEAQ